MRVLVIDEEFPWPLHSGKRIRTYHLIRELSRRHRITYLAYGHPDSPAVAHFDSMSIEPVLVRPPNRTQEGLRFYGRLLFNLASPHPYTVTSQYTARFHAELRRRVASKRYDLVICEWSPYARFLCGLNGIKKVIVAHNLESAIWRRYEETERHPLRRWYVSVQRQKMEEFEGQCFSWANGATAVSESDAGVIRAQYPGLPVEVIENGVDVNHFQPPQNGAGSTPTVMFSGAMDWRPNQDAASYFVSEVWPLVRKRHPTARAFLVGREPSAAIRTLGKEAGVTVTGTVDDVRPYIAQASVCIVPLRVGGGSRLKILEAMAMGRAVVSTRVGAEGLRVRDGEHLLVADSPEDFSQAVDRCLNDAALRTQLGTSGRRLVEAQYGWGKIAAVYEDFLHTLTHG
jgi:sugar transferase (PEP-CTERM/EpsH1 system associated)